MAKSLMKGIRTMAPATILTNPTEVQLESAVEENLFDLFRAMVRVLPGSELVEGDKLCYHLAFPTNPMFKGVWQTCLPADEVEDAIDHTLAWFKDRNAPFLFWWTGPGTQPDDLGERLMARGLLSMEGQMEELAPGIRQTAAGAPGMVADLRREWGK